MDNADANTKIGNPKLRLRWVRFLSWFFTPHELATAAVWSCKKQDHHSAVLCVLQTRERDGKIRNAVVSNAKGPTLTGWLDEVSCQMRMLHGR